MTLVLPTLTAGHVLTAAEITQIEAAAADQTVYVRKTIDETIASSTTIQDDDELQLAVAASTFYEVTGFILYTAGGAASVNGIKMGWSGPAGATLDWVPHGKLDTDGTNTCTSIWQGALSIGSTINMGGAGASALVAKPYGFLLTSTTAGTLKFRFAQGTSSGTGTVVKAASVLMLRRIG